MQDQPTFKKKQKNLNDYARYSGIVFQMVIIILAGTFGGIKLDSKLKLQFPVFTIILSLLSVGFAIYIVIKDFIVKKDE